MARLDDLIRQVSDGDLRREIQQALDATRRKQQFGLVFEEHVPETASLYSLPVKVGSIVELRHATPRGLFRVKSLKKTRATIESIPTADENLEVPVKDLLVVKRFGEPIYPALMSVGSVVGSDSEGPHHAVIDGENFHVLQLLAYLYEGQVDCIYIDPPYNTGATAWKYNNSYVDKTDGWRHSKWLSFMEKRLLIARRLLAPDGVLICTIGEHEVHHLGMLLEQVFTDYESYMVAIVHNPKGTNDDNFARSNEFAFFCVPAETERISALAVELFSQAANPEAMTAVAAGEVETEDYYLRRRGQESGHRRLRKNQFYAILVDEDARRVVGVGPALGLDEPYEITREGSVVTVYPLDTRGEERVWRYNRSTMQRYIEAGAIVVTGYSKRTGQGWVLNHRVTRRPTKKLKTVWWEKRHDAGAHGSDLLTAYIGESARFPFPKSVYAVRDCLGAVVEDSPDALILDFFAGSGTTLHATALLNSADGGHRRCIMVTNNEVDPTTQAQLNSKRLFQGDVDFERHGVFEAVTRPRVEAVITGAHADGTAVEGEHVWADRRPYSQGFPESVEFFKLQYLDPDEVGLGGQFEAILPALWLAAGAVGAREIPAPGSLWTVPEGSRYGVLFGESHFRRFLGALEKRPEITHVWMVTDSDEAFAEMRAQLPTHVTASMLYRDYLRNFMINTERNL